MKLEELGTAIKERQEAVSGIFAVVDEKQEGVATKEQREQIQRLNHEAEEMEQSYKSLLEQDSMRAAAKSREAWLREAVRPLTFGSGGTKSGEAESRGDLLAVKGGYGEAVLADEQLQAWIKSVSPNGQVAKDVKLQSVPVHLNFGFKSLCRPAHDYAAVAAQMEAVKALVTGAGTTSGGPFVNIDYRGLLDRGTFERPLVIRDLITVLQTNSDTVEYIRLGTHTNAAGPVAEATATGGTSGTKPESSLVTAAVTDTVKTIAHWIPATRRALQDAPQLRDLIDSFLRYGLAEEVEDQIISGAGTGENFTGLLNVSGTQSQAFDTDLLTTYRKARTKVKLVGRAMATGYVIHPNDLEDLDLLTDNEARYYYGGPAGGGVPRLWGVPVVESEAMTEGTAMVGDWRMAVLWDRMQTAIYMSDSHSDFFIRNLLAVLAELRAGFGVLRPAAFVEIALS